MSAKTCDHAVDNPDCDHYDEDASQKSLKVGDRVAKDLKRSGSNPAHTALGTVRYVKPDRVGVEWDARAPFVFPAKRDEIRKV